VTMLVSAGYQKMLHPSGFITVAILPVDQEAICVSSAFQELCFEKWHSREKLQELPKRAGKTKQIYTE